MIATKTEQQAARGKKILSMGLLVATFMAACLLLLLLATKPAHAATTFPVNSTGDQSDADLDDDPNVCDTDLVTPRNQCTLRAAIEEASATANDTDGADTINFSIDPGSDPGCDPTSKVCFILPASPLPDITDPVTIDGYSQGETTADPADDARPATSTSNAVLKIELFAHQGAAGLTNGLKITAANSTIKGLVFNGWPTGVWIDGSGATGNKVEGNYIGTDASGKEDLGNSTGVVIFDAANNTIGGTTAGARNIISGNGPLFGSGFENGVSIFGSGATGNKVMGNYIGTDKDGTSDLGNSQSGVGLSGATTTTSNFVGGTASGAPNVIAFNGRDGVQVAGSSFTGNRILSNAIHSNDGLGIDLLGAGESNTTDVETPNDDKDPDEGPNDLQNKPKITSAKPTTKGKKKFTTIKGTFNSTSGQTFTIQLFRNLPGEEQGRTLLKQFPSITTDADGNANFGTRVKRGAAPVRSSITATATNNATGDTSEFSTACTVRAVRCPS